MNTLSLAVLAREWHTTRHGRLHHYSICHPGVKHMGSCCVRKGHVYENKTKRDYLLPDGRIFFFLSVIDWNKCTWSHQHSLRVGWRWVWLRLATRGQQRKKKKHVMSLMMHVIQERRDSWAGGREELPLSSIRCRVSRGASYLVLTADALQEETCTGNKQVTEWACAPPRDPQPPHTELKIKQMELEELFWSEPTILLKRYFT